VPPSREVTLILLATQNKTQPQISFETKQITKINVKTNNIILDLKRNIMHINIPKDFIMGPFSLFEIFP
jgi:hypothetical protein